VSEADAWLDRNTFRCALGRVTPAQCEANRSKAGWLEPRRRAPGGLRWESKRPSKCEGCVEHERLIREFREKQEETEKIMPEQVKPKQTRRGRPKVGICCGCHEEKEIIAKGKCRSCYDKARPPRVRIAKRGEETTLAGDGSGTPLPPFDPTFARIGPALGSAGGGQLTLHFEGDDEQLLAWLDRDRMTSRRQTIEDHVLHILDTWRAMRERINMEEAQLRIGAARGGQT